MNRHASQQLPCKVHCLCTLSDRVGNGPCLALACSAAWLVLMDTTHAVCRYAGRLRDQSGHNAPGRPAQVQVSWQHRQAGTSKVLLLGMMAGPAHQLLPQRCHSSACLGDQDSNLKCLTAVRHCASCLTVSRASNLIQLAITVAHNAHCSAQGHGGLRCSTQGGHAPHSTRG